MAPSSGSAAVDLVECEADAAGYSSMECCRQPDLNAVDPDPHPSASPNVHSSFAPHLNGRQYAAYLRDAISA